MTVVSYQRRLDALFASLIIPLYDIVVDCSDNAKTRYLLNDLCVLENKPLVSGSAVGWTGQV